MLGSTAVVKNSLADGDALGSLVSPKREFLQGSLFGVSDIEKPEFKKKIAPAFEDNSYDNDPESQAESGSEVGVQDSSTPSLLSEGNIQIPMHVPPEPNMTVAPISTPSIPKAPRSDFSTGNFGERLASAFQDADTLDHYPLISEAVKIDQEPKKRLRKKVPVSAQPDLTASRCFSSSDMWDLQNGSKIRALEKPTAADVPTVRRRSLSDLYQPTMIDNAESLVDSSPLPGMIKKTKPKKRSLSGISQPDLIGLGPWAAVRPPDSMREIDVDEQYPIEMGEKTGSLIPEFTPRWENINTLKLLSPITETMLSEQEQNDGRPAAQGGPTQSNQTQASLAREAMSLNPAENEPGERNGPFQSYDISSPVRSIQASLPYEEHSAGRKDNDGRSEGNLVQGDGLIKSSGEISPISSIPALLLYDSMSSDHKENGHSDEPSVQRESAIQSSSEGFPINMIQAPLLNEAKLQHDGHPRESPVGRNESSTDSSPISSIQLTLPYEMLASDDGYLVEPSVPPSGLIETCGDVSLNSPQTWLPGEALSSDRDESDANSDEYSVQRDGPIQSSTGNSPTSSMRPPFPYEAMSENDDHPGVSTVERNGGIPLPRDRLPMNSIQAPLAYKAMPFDGEENEPLGRPPVQQNSVVDSSLIQSPLPYETPYFDGEKNSLHYGGSLVQQDGPFESSGDIPPISNGQAPDIVEEAFYDNLSPSHGIHQKLQDPKTSSQLLGIQQTSHDAYAPVPPSPQPVQSSSADSGYETASSSPESKFTVNFPDEIDESRSPESSGSPHLRVADLEQPRTTDSEVRRILDGEDSKIGKNDANDGAQNGDGSSDVMIASAYISVSQDQSVAEDNLLKLTGTSAIHVVERALSEGTALSCAVVQDMKLSKADGKEKIFAEATDEFNSEISPFHAKPYAPEGDLRAATIKNMSHLVEHVPPAIFKEESHAEVPKAKQTLITSEYKRRGTVLTMDDQPANTVTSDNQVTDELAVLAQIEALNKMLMNDSRAPNSNMGGQESGNVRSRNPTNEFGGEEIDFWNRFSAHGENLAKRETDMFAKRIETGVPSSCRGKVWMILTESISQDFIREYEDCYKHARLHYESTIIRDVRTRSGDTSALRRLMAAYFALDSRLGYCFNLQYLAQTLLDNMSEAESLCTLSSVMKSPGVYRLREWYCGEGLEVVLYQLGRLMEEHLPELASHLSSRKVSLGDYWIKWFTSLFTASAPPNFAIRIVDLYFLEGPKFIFKVAVVLLRTLERSLLLCASLDEIENVLNQMLFISFDVPDQLIQQALAIPGISESKLEQYEVECKIRTWRTRQSMDSAIVKEGVPEEKKVENARPVSATPSEAPVAPVLPSLSPTPSSSMIPSGLYSLFVRASRRRSEASGKYTSHEASLKNATSGTHSRTGSASSTISGTKPGLFQPTRKSEEARDIPTTFSKISALVLPSEFPGKNVPKDQEGLLRKSEEKRARLEVALSSSASKNVNLANDLLVAQNLLARERGSISALCKEMNALQIQMAESEIRTSMMEAELKLLRSRMDQNELESMRMKGKWDRLMTALLDG